MPEEIKELISSVKKFKELDDAYPDEGFQFVRERKVHTNGVNIKVRIAWEWKKANMLEVNTIFRSIS